MNTTVSSINEKTEPIKRHEIMAGLSASRIGSFVAQFSRDNDKAPTTVEADEVSNGVSASTASFSNFDAVGNSEIENLQATQESAREIYYGDPEEEKNKETADMVRDQAMDEMREKEERRLKERMSFNGFEFSIEALQAVAEEELSDFEKTARERGWNEEQSNTIEAELIILANPKSSTEQKEEAMRAIERTDPNYANELAEKMRKKDIELGNSVERNIELGSTITNENDSVIDVTKENTSAISHAIESGKLSDEQAEIASEVVQNKLEATQSDFDTLFDMDGDDFGSFSENITPNNNTQSIASNFANATNPAGDFELTSPAPEIEKTKTFDVTNAIT